MQTIERGGYSRQEVIDMLHGKYGSRTVSFRYDLLDKDERKKGELTRVESGEVSMSAFSTIKRTATFTLEHETVDIQSYYTWEDFGGHEWADLETDHKLSYWSETYTLEKDAVDKVNWLSDRIQPFILFQMPDGGWIEFSLGVFIPSSPRRVDRNGQELREVEAYDGLVILDQDKFTERWSITAGTTYEKAVTDILKSAGISKYKLEFVGDDVLRNDREYALGESKLKAINDLLSAKNNTPLWVDSAGYFVSEPYRPPNEKAIEYTYSTDEMSIIVEGIEEELDLFEVANSWVVTVSNPEIEPMVARKQNNNPDSPTSIPSRGRTIVDYREIDDISSQSALNAYVDRIAHEASQTYGKVVFSTPIMPFHEYHNVIRLKYDPLEIDDTFSETNWTIPLEAGAMMTHEVRKVVNI